MNVSIAPIDNEFLELQRVTEHLEFCGTNCNYEHKRDFPLRHKPANCLLCHTHKPSGHVVVTNAEGKNIGRVCSSHSYWDTIKLGGGRLMVSVQLVGA